MDRRGYKKRIRELQGVVMAADGTVPGSGVAAEVKISSNGAADVMDVNDTPGDAGGWLTPERGNRVKVGVSSPHTGEFGQILVERIFGI